MKPGARLFWARECTRFHVYPQEQPLTLVIVEPDGPGFWRIRDALHGYVIRVPMVLEAERGAA